MPDEKKPTQYAVIELFGHAKIAGAVSEQQFGGTAFVRVDVPEIRLKERDYDAPRGEDGMPVMVERVIQAHTRSFGAGAIYSINWCDEAGALAAAMSIRHEPIQPFSVAKALASMPDQRTRLLGVAAVHDADDEEFR